jgi:hypothetical protein
LAAFFAVIFAFTFGVGLGAVNLLGYIKCQKNHKMAV